MKLRGTLPICEPLPCDANLPWERDEEIGLGYVDYAANIIPNVQIQQNSLELGGKYPSPWIPPDVRYPHLNFTECRNTPSKRLSISADRSGFNFDT